MKFIFPIIFALLTTGISAQQTIKNVDAATFKQLIEKGSVVVVDLRTDEEIKKHGMIPGSVHMDYLDKDAEKKIGALDRRKMYLVYCAGGGRSTDCAESMQKLGFSSIVNLQNGFTEWKNKGYEIQRK